MTFFLKSVDYSFLVAFWKLWIAFLGCQSSLHSAIQLMFLLRISVTDIIWTSEGCLHHWDHLNNILFKRPLSSSGLLNFKAMFYSTSSTWYVIPHTLASVISQPFHFHFRKGEVSSAVLCVTDRRKVLLSDCLLLTVLTFLYQQFMGPNRERKETKPFVLACCVWVENTIKG